MKDLKSPEEFENEFMKHEKVITTALEKLIAVVEKCGVAGIAQRCNGYMVTIKMDTKNIKH